MICNALAAESHHVFGKLRPTGKAMLARDYALSIGKDNSGALTIGRQQLPNIGMALRHPSQRFGLHLAVLPEKVFRLFLVLLKIGTGNVPARQSNRRNSRFDEIDGYGLVLPSRKQF